MQAEQEICIRMGKRIRQLRRNRGMRQIDLTEKADISVTHLSDLENGRREIGLIMIHRLANAFDVHPADLLK